MRAIRFHELGGLEVLTLDEVPIPEPGRGQVLVRVRACGVNRLDLMVRDGRAKLTSHLPHIPGSEVAGEVEQIGEGVSGVIEGQRVVVAPYLFCGHCEYCLAGEETVCLRSSIVGLTGNGGYAEYMLAPAENLVPIPEDVPFDAAAAVTLAAITAWHLLIERARVRAGDVVLIHAAGSGVGSAAIQIAKLSGARVIATAGSGEKVRLAMELGADEAINYREKDFLQEVRRLTSKRGVDLVVEHIGADSWEKSAASLSRGGRLAICGTTSGTEATTNLWQLFAKQLSFLGSYGGTRLDLQKVLRLVAEARLRPVIDRALPLEKAGEAQRLLEARQNFGKVILNP